MGCGVYWTQLNEVNRALGSLRRLGIGADTPAFLQLNTLRGKLMSQVGFKFPRSPLLLLKLVGLSPGSITLFHDPEFGWVTKAVEGPGAVSVYHNVGDDIAAALLKGELTHDQFEVLKVPDDYYGE